MPKQNIHFLSVFERNELALPGYMLYKYIFSAKRMYANISNNLDIICQIWEGN